MVVYAKDRASRSFFFFFFFWQHLSLSMAEASHGIETDSRSSFGKCQVRLEAECGPFSCETPA